MILSFLVLRAANIFRKAWKTTERWVSPTIYHHALIALLLQFVKLGYLVNEVFPNLDLEAQGVQEVLRSSLVVRDDVLQLRALQDVEWVEQTDV